LDAGGQNSVLKICVLLMILPVCSAHAFIDTPVFSPLPIPANQPFFVTIRAGICDGFPVVDTPIDVFVVAPNRVQLFVTGIHQVDPILCNIGTGSARFNLPALAAGTYQFEFYVRNIANPAIPIHNGPVVPFTVVGADLPIQVSALNRFGLVTLVLMLLSGAMFRRWRAK
jgi:hypothetical protein